ncbi:kinase-like domain-containing protein [Nemania sp. FL0031]|nr:kinase-like domain-containing protein [Nemania sp. FL0031]
MEAPVTPVNIPISAGIQLTAAQLFELSQEAQNEAIQAFSTSKTWQYEKVLGNGSYGFTLLMIDRDPLHLHRPRRVALKRPILPQFGVEDFDREVAVLKDLRGHAHIVQLIDYAEDVTNYQSISGKAGRFIRRIIATFRNPPKNLYRSLSGGTGPAIVLEYLENGNLTRIVNAVHYRHIRLPNRLLWSWYHCLVSACVAMTYKKEGRVGGPLEIEKPQGRDTEHYRLTHRDIAERNIMVGSREPSVQTHRLAPKLVMIDFGLARRERRGNEEYSEERNLEDINCVMLNLIDPGILRDRAGYYLYEWNGMNTMAAGLFDENRLPLLDPELRSLLAESFQVYDDDAARRPTLGETWIRTQQGMRKNPSEYRARIRETDEYIWALLQRLLYDADVYDADD